LYISDFIYIPFSIAVRNAFSWKLKLAPQHQSLKNTKNGTSKIHAHRTNDKRKTQNQNQNQNSNKWKTQPEIYHMSPPQIAEGTPKVGTEPADSHQEAKPTANKLADS
jgi:hypothetical protein